MAGCGFWREVFTVQTSTQTVDALGQADLSWLTVGTVRGMIKPTQREVVDDLGVSIRTDLDIETAWSPIIDARSRLILDGTTYNVSSVVDPDSGRKKRLRVIATEVTQ
ncbi:Bacteriophage SPP1, head-tail adaptor [uncultured Caudovirales phage]|uniref:Bacteriophage SPP1, head-tail adaptor n=1 Tax=uncultured Caudovirales phage TaxID=2100421 RepID=A0A6J5RDB8_9CAUD|nr:Bacteriophage SPP1, head-tail adaptor [uncultured Caudovirales phage]